MRLTQPRIKRSLPLGVYGDGRIQIGLCELKDVEERSIELLVDLMDGTRTREEVTGALVAARAHLDRASVEEVIDQLTSLGLVEDAIPSPPAELSQRELERHARGADYFAMMDDQPRS